MTPGNFYVYILTNNSRVLYVGVTNDLARRVSQHRLGEGGKFTKKYNVQRLVWYQRFNYANDAIAAEKRIKSWTRAKKLSLINASNPKWNNLLPDETDAQARSSRRSFSD